MPIEVELPGGAVVEFPDGTDNATMERALRAYRSPPAADFGDVQSGVASTEGLGTQSSSAAPRRTLTQDVGRTLGLGARAMLGGAADLVGIVANPFIEGVNALGEKGPTTRSLITGEPERRWERQATMREGAEHLSDLIGLPAPETSAERISGDVTSALTGGGGLIGVGRNLAARAPGIVRAVGEGLASQPATQLAGAAGGSGASSVTREAGGSPTAQVLAGVAGGFAPALAKTGGAGTVRRVVRGGEEGRRAMERNTWDFRMLGAEPSVGQASGNRVIQGTESLLAASPTSSGVVSRAAERQADAIGSGLRQVAEDFVPNASAERAGRAVERGVEQFGRNASATKRALYWQADRFIPETTAVPLSNTWQAVVKLTTPTQGATATTGALVNPRIAQLRQTLEQDLAAGGGQIPYAALKRIRSDIGEAISDFSLSPDTPTRELKQLYASLSHDMESAAQSQGPEAVQAAKRANNYTRAVADRLENVQRVVDKNGGPERVFNAVMSGTRDGGTTLRAVMQSLPKEGQEALTGAVIKRMGLANPGQQGAEGADFSAQTFLTNWNRVSPEARRALFDRHGPKFVANMERIARVADNLREGSRVFANPSGTANRAAALTYAGSLGAALLSGQLQIAAGLGAGGGIANLTARALNNPRFVTWLSRATEVPVSTASQQIMQLKAIAETAKDDELAEIAKGLEEQTRNQQTNSNQGAQH